MSDYLADVDNKLLQNGELCGRQPYLYSSQSHNMPRKIDLQVAKLFYACHGRRYLPLSTTQHSTHTGQEFLHPKGLGQVIVCTEIKSCDFVTFSIKRSQHNDGHSRMLTYAPTDFQSVHARHHDIQNQQVRVLPLPQGHSFQPVTRF